MLSNSSQSTFFSDRVELIVIPTPQYSTASGLQDLNRQAISNIKWNRNNTLTGDAVVGQRFNISTLENRMSKLTIWNPNAGDSGVYVAAPQSFFSESNGCWLSFTCDGLAASLLTHNAITRPIAYEVTIQGQKPGWVRHRR